MKAKAAMEHYDKIISDIHREQARHFDEWQRHDKEIARLITQLSAVRGYLVDLAAKERKSDK